MLIKISGNHCHDGAAVQIQRNPPFVLLFCILHFNFTVNFSIFRIIFYCQPDLSDCKVLISNTDYSSQVSK